MRARRSAQPTGRGFAASSARTSAISLSSIGLISRCTPLLPTALVGRALYVEPQNDDAADAHAYLKPAL
jgi:hypothetical protein